MENISIDDLHDKVDCLGPNDLILDVRGSDEFDSGHIKGARNQPHDEVEDIVQDLMKFDTVYVHCKMGGRAQIASQALSGMGLTNIVCVGNGGMQRWSDQGWETE
jgi:rhodanese-related sulfurtransferase